MFFEYNKVLPFQALVYPTVTFDKLSHTYYNSIAWPNLLTCVGLTPTGEVRRAYSVLSHTTTHLSHNKVWGMRFKHGGAILMLWYDYKKEQLNLCKAIGFTPLGDVGQDHFVYLVECNFCKHRYRWNSHARQLKHMKANHPQEYLKLAEGLNGFNSQRL